MVYIIVLDLHFLRSRYSFINLTLLLWPILLKYETETKQFVPINVCVIVSGTHWTGGCPMEQLYTELPKSNSAAHYCEMRGSSYSFSAFCDISGLHVSIYFGHHQAYRHTNQL
jgi:hypothetical protein